MRSDRVSGRRITREDQRALVIRLFDGPMADLSFVRLRRYYMPCKSKVIYISTLAMNHALFLSDCICDNDWLPERVMERRTTRLRHLLVRPAFLANPQAIDPRVTSCSASTMTTTLSLRMETWLERKNIKGWRNRGWTVARSSKRILKN